MVIKMPKMYYVDEFVILQLRLALKYCEKDPHKAKVIIETLLEEFENENEYNRN